MRRIIIIVGAVMLACSVLPAFAEPPEEHPGKIKGEVVQVRQRTMLQNEGEFTEIKVRTRNQQEMWLQVGPSEEYGNKFQVGDPVRARVMWDGDEPPKVQKMLNYRSREQYRIRDGSGQMIQAQNRYRHKEATGEQSQIRTQTRTGQPDSAGGQGQDQRRGGGGGRR